MKIAFDTNVILDAIESRADYKTAQALILAVAREQISGMVAGSSVTDIYYIAKKHIGDAAAREAISNLLTVFDVACVDGEICGDALDLPMPDYEDAVLACCAARAAADYIVTRDQDFLDAESCPVERIAPAALLAVLSAE